MSKKFIPRANPEEVLPELLTLDEQLAELLTQRANLVSKVKPSAKGRRDRHKTWADFEKNVRKQWEEAGTKAGMDSKRWRQVFALLQELEAPAKSVKEAKNLFDEGQESQDEEKTGFLLIPRKEAIACDLEGPKSLLQTRLFAALATQSAQPAFLPEILSNDSFYDCMKALNQVGAHLYVDDGGLNSRGTQELSFFDKAIYVGQDHFTLYLLFFLAITNSGSIRFTGGADLKFLDLKPLSALLPKLGTRLVNMSRSSNGLPVRLECSGIIPDEVILSKNTPVMAAHALLAAAPSYKNGLRVVLPNELLELVAPTVDFLQSCGINASTESNAVVVKPSTVRLPEDLEQTLDPFLCASILSKPCFARQAQSETGAPAGGEMALKGTWPKASKEHKTVFALLENAGLALEASSQGIKATYTQNDTGTDQDFVAMLNSTSYPDYFPLALAMAVASLHNTTSPNAQAKLFLTGDAEQANTAFDVLERAGIQVEEQDDALILQKGERASDWDAPWTSPSAGWTIAYALISFVRPGLKLANPGSISEILPAFWPLFNSLPRPDASFALHVKPKKEAKSTEQNDKPKRRRIRV